MKIFGRTIPEVFLPRDFAAIIALNTIDRIYIHYG